MRFYIMTDMEGVSGVVDYEKDCSPGGVHYEKSKRLTTLEVNAAIEGILSTGNHEIIVCDGHGPGGIDIELLHREAQLIMGRPLDPMFGIDDGPFDAFLMIGQHAMKGTPGAALAHTFSSKNILSLTLNGTPIGEAGINALRAGIYDIPTIFLSGDRAACEEIRRIIPGIHTCAVKKAIKETSALCLQPEKAREKIKEAAAYAVTHMEGIRPFKLDPPYEAIFEFVRPNQIEPYRNKKYCHILSETKVAIYADDMETLLKERLWAG
ncbi:MAG: M55 family metallopeptidase [Planifilum fulgidum]